MAQSLGELLVLAENMGSVPTTHVGQLTTTLTPLTEVPTPSSGFLWHLHAYSAHTSKQKLTYTQTNVNLKN